MTCLAVELTTSLATLFAAFLFVNLPPSPKSSRKHKCCCRTLCDSDSYRNRLRTHSYMPFQFSKTQYSLYLVKLFKFRTSTIGISAFSIFNKPVSET